VLSGYRDAHGIDDYFERSLPALLIDRELPRVELDRQRDCLVDPAVECECR
jgi:hypothetical protein